MKKFLKSFFVFLLIIVLFAAAAASAGLVYLTVNEYNPADTEDLDFYGTATKGLSQGDTVTVLTYNIGHGFSDSSHDFFLYGGKTVKTESSDIINENLNGITEIINEQNADIDFLQEVDIDSKLSYNIDQASYITSSMYNSNFSFAPNLLCSYIPYPVTNNIGKTHSGIMNVNKFTVDSALRSSLKNSYEWPQSTVRHKYCMLIERTPIQDSTKQLVTINLQFDGEDSSTNEAQFKALCEFMQLEFAKGNYVIAGGDFNGMLPSVNKNKYPSVNTEYYDPSSFTTEHLTEGWKYCTDDSTPTARLMNVPYDKNSSDNQFYVIDGFITSPNTIVESTKTIDTDFRCSSHNPVLIKVTLV